MAKTKHKKVKNQELDSVYLFKLVLYLIIGAQWLRVGHGNNQVPVPIGLVVGVLFAMHEHFRIDRKIEYAVLLIATLVGFWSQAGFYLNI